MNMIFIVLANRNNGQRIDSYWGAIVAVIVW